MVKIDEIISAWMAELSRFWLRLDYMTNIYVFTMATMNENIVKIISIFYISIYFL